MARHTQTLACLVVLLAVTSSEKEQTRWSRQISSYTADISDWVPLAGPAISEPPRPKINTPIKRQAIAEPRILTEPFPGFTRPTGFGQDAFPSRTYFNSPANRQMYLQSVPSAPQNYLTDQGFGQALRFGLSQPNYPLNQGFAAPQYTFENPPAIKPRPPQSQLSNPIKFESYPKQSIAQIPQTKPFINQAPKLKPEEPKYIDESVSKKKAQSLQKLKFDPFEKLPKTETIPPKPKSQKEEVQLLYVPLESLNRGQFNFRGPIAAPQIINSDLYSQGLPKIEPLKQTFTSEFQRPVAKPIENFGQDYFGNFDSVKEFDQVPKFSTLSSPFPTASPTTPKPKKLKPHQPPLAIFQEAKNSQIKVGDVLSSLKNANTIAVLDTVNPLNAPKVFIGPSSLTPPEGFFKFELPYLSNIENSDKKLRQLPFFVAPLSYNTPNGFAKIPFPSPHVGSVVINSLIKENPSTHQTQKTYSTPPVYSTPSSNVAFKEQQQYKQEQKPATQKPSFNYYSTISPKTNAPLNQQSNYYSFEPQTVTSLSPQNQQAPLNPTPQKGNYFLSNVNGDAYNPSHYVNFPSQNEYRNPELARPYTVAKPETTTALRTTITTTTTTPKPSTYSSQLLETHNPYSINQAFHFSTPLDYHNYFDEFKETYAPPGVSLEVPKSSTVPVSSTPNPTKPQEIITEKPGQQTSPNYVQNYSPEIQYESEVPGARYPTYNTNDYYSTSKTAAQQSTKDINSDNFQAVYTPESQHAGRVQSQSGNENLTETIINRITGPSSDVDNSKVYEQYETNYASNEQTSSTTSTTTTTTTTRRPPIRSRGRPRYTTSKPDTNEPTTRATYTRKPLRERRPLPPRSRYEPNKISTEKTTKKSVDSNESTTKSARTRTRGRVQYKPSDNDEYYDRKNKGSNNKEEDLAYQRDILHQNYPVTLMERTSTVDIEAITEPSPRISSTKSLESATDNYDTENAYAHESAAISQFGNSDISDVIPNYTSRVETQHSDIVAPNYSTRYDEFYQSRSSTAPALATNEESLEKQEDFSRHTPTQRVEKTDVSSHATETVSINTEQPSYSVNIAQNFNQEEITTNQDTEISKTESQEGTVEEHPEENAVQTTPSYNRVRVRPGVIRQYHQASSTDSSRTKTDRRRPVQAITYRPAFDKRRTTMRIDEIEADLKTKQVHARPDQDYRHPVYKPDPSVEGTTASTVGETTKRGHFRRRRPTYTTTSTEAASTKKIYEVKNRFRGRRPTTEKPSEKLDTQTESISTTVRNTPYSRYSHRPRLSERYNKKTEPEPEHEESEDQDSNYSINRPKYVAPENEQWSPKITSESFKPYNPNDILDESKLGTTERRSDIVNDGELDIITARNDYDDILISVTPATNNRGVKKIPDIPPTLEALVEQSKTTNSDSTDNMSTFETMLEEVMKSLEEQDKDEYTSKVMKHKGGEIGEIPPEKIITSDDDYASKTTTALDQEMTTIEPTADVLTNVNEEQHKGPKSRRRGFWKKVKVRPVNTESIEVAESQYYSNTVNRLGESIKKTIHDKSDKQVKPRVTVTTYKPSFQFINAFESEDVSSPEASAVVDIDIPKITSNPSQTTKAGSPSAKDEEIITTTVVDKDVITEKSTSLGDEDLGTGSPDSTIIDNIYYSTPTEPTASEGMFGMLNKADGFSLMDYLFGTTSSDSVSTENKNETSKEELKKTTALENIEITTDQPKPKIVTTETSYIPEEITSVPSEESSTENIAEFEDIKKVFEDDKPKETVTEPTASVVVTSESSFMNPSNVVSTSMSTEISHETEICFRGKCIKTSKDIL